MCIGNYSQQSIIYNTVSFSEKSIMLWAQSCLNLVLFDFPNNHMVKVLHVVRK